MQVGQDEKEQTDMGRTTAEADIKSATIQSTTNRISSKTTDMRRPQTLCLTGGGQAKGCWRAQEAPGTLLLAVRLPEASAECETQTQEAVEFSDMITRVAEAGERFNAS